MKTIHVGAAVSFVAAWSGTASHASAQSITADDHAFQTSPLDSTGIANKRAAAIKFIWGTPVFPINRLPSKMKRITTSPVAGLTNVKYVEALRISMEANQYSIGYHFFPDSNRRNALVVVHEGHAPGCYLDDGPNSGKEDGGIQRTIKALVADGYGVLAMTMPGFTPPEPGLPDPGNCTGGHDALFSLSLSSGNALKFFMEPIAAAINYLASAIGYRNINMVGLSGGGWTTTLYSALDTRIATSFPVAGTVPLYLRVSPYSQDTEQFLPAFYSPPGIAGYPDLYLLGSRGTGRTQVQILNRHDSCCFGEPQHNTSFLGIAFEPAIRVYESRVKEVAPTVSGYFRTFIDEVSPYHMISDNAIQNVILPVLHNPSAASSLPSTIRSGFGSAGNMCIDIPDFGRPPQNNDYVQVYPCHGSSNQEFSLASDGTIREQRSGLCLDVPDFGRPPQNRDQMQVYQCHGGVNQQFDMLADGTIRNRSNGLCLDLPNYGRDPQAGDRLQVFQCRSTANQVFSANKPTTEITSMWSPGLCIDLPDFGRPPQNNDYMQVYSCHGGQNQRFNLQSDGTIRTEVGALCLDVPDFGRPPANGDKLQVYQCHGTINQQFDVQSDGTITSRTQGGLCIDIPDYGRSPQSGDRLQMYQCHGSVNQRFNITR